MQKIEECDSTNDSESHTSHYPIIRLASVNKKSVHFEPNFSKKNSLSDTVVDSPSSDNLNVIRKIPAKNSKLTSTNLIPLKKRRRINMSTSKYLVCFKNGKSRRETSEDIDSATSKLEVYDNVNATKLANNNITNINKKPGSFESNQSTFEFNKNTKEREISGGFSTNIMRIFRNFNLKNQCCCR